MVQHQGVRLDGGAFEEPDLADFKVAGGRNTRNNTSKTIYQRLKGVDFDEKWYNKRVQRGALGIDEACPLWEFLTRLLFFHSSEDEDGGKCSSGCTHPQHLRLVLASASRLGR